MPCFTTSRMSVEFDAEHFDLLEDALKGLGYQTSKTSNYVSFYTSNGRVTISNKRIDLDERDKYLVDKIKVAYSREIVKTVTKRFNWASKEKTQNHFTFTKR